MTQLFLWVMIVLEAGIQIAVSQLSDTVYAMDATITDSAECQCQKNIFKFLTTLSRPNNARFGLTAYADTTILLYRLTWPFNGTQWSQIVDSMACTGGSARIDRAFALAQQMFTKAGRPNSTRAYNIMISRTPAATFVTALTNLSALGVSIYADILATSGISSGDILALASKSSIFPFSSYCSFLAQITTSSG